MKIKIYFGSSERALIITDGKKEKVCRGVVEWFQYDNTNDRMESLSMSSTEFIKESLKTKEPTYTVYLKEKKKRLILNKINISYIEVHDE